MESANFRRTFKSTQNHSEENDSEEQVTHCMICKKAFVNSRGVKQHIGKIHRRSEKRIKCEKCLKKFKTKYSLKAHQMSVHEKVTQITCIVCSKVFSSKYTHAFHKKKFHPPGTSIE
jgi:uncharacterized Zn-finger protein